MRTLESFIAVSVCIVSMSSVSSFVFQQLTSHPAITRFRSRRIASITTQPWDTRLSETFTKRFFASIAADTEILNSRENDEELLLPEQFSIEMPAALSPSSIKAFRDCPQSFLFQYIYKIRQPTNQALATGTFCHSALEQVFELPPEDRTLPNLQNLFRKCWAQKRLADEYRHLFEEDNQRNVDAEIAWGKYSLSLLENYWKYEDPSTVQRPNPVQREVWVRSQIPNGKDSSFLVRGIVDRFDMVRDEQKNVALRLLDYKTGKAPDLKYSPAMNQKIRDEAFEQLKIYALLYKGELPLRFLRLLFLTSQQSRAVAMDLDLGATKEERDEVLRDVEQGLVEVWNDIAKLVAMQDPKAWTGCNRSFCFCHTCRPTFVPGSVWEP